MAQPTQIRLEVGNGFCLTVECIDFKFSIDDGRFSLQMDNIDIEIAGNYELVINDRAHVQYWSMHGEPGTATNPILIEPAERGSPTNPILLDDDVGSASNPIVIDSLS